MLAPMPLGSRPLYMSQRRLGAALYSGPCCARPLTHARTLAPGAPSFQQRLPGLPGATSPGTQQGPEQQQQQQQQPASPEPEENSHFGKLLKLLSKYQATSWLAGLAERLLKSAVPERKGTLRAIRLVLILGMFCVAALTREMSLQNSRVRPREVLYSAFVAMLDEGRVKAARLESGTSKLYFDISTPDEATTTAATVAVAGAATASAATATTTAAAAAATAPAAAAVSSGAGQAALASASASSGVPAVTASGATSTFKHRMQKQYFIKLADKNDPLLVHRVVAAGVEFAVVKASLLGTLYNILITALAVWLPLLPLIFLVRRIMEDRNSSTRKKKSSSAENVSVTFDDVAGVDSAKLELAEVVSVMKSVKASYKRLKVKMPSGVLLCGPPGTGKTLLAKAVAGEAGIPFMAVSASEFVEMYVGRGAARIRELFAEARKVAPCVVFIDELDAVGARRGMGYNDERDQTLNQLLTELDGFEGRPGVLFLAATNRMDVLDPALLRPGRLSRKVVVPLPDESGRRDILTVHLRGVPLDEQEDKEDVVLRLARVTSGFSGAELANVVNEASLLAARKTQDFVAFRELLEGVQRTRYGVNGQTASKDSLQQSINGWLMNIATENTSSRKAKNAVA